MVMAADTTVTARRMADKATSSNEPVRLHIAFGGANDKTLAPM